VSGFDLINQILGSKTGLSGARKLALLTLAHFSKDGICYPAVQRIADCMEVSEGQARRLIKELEAEGYVVKKLQDGRRTNTYQINIIPCKNATLADSQPLQKCNPCKNAGSTLADMQGGSYLYNEPTNEPIKDTDVSKKKYDYDEIINLYHEHCPSLKPVRKLNDQRKNIIRRRFKEGYTVSDFIQVFKNAEADDWLAGRNQRYDGANIDLILRNGRVDKFLQLLESTPRQQEPEEPQLFEPANRMQVMKQIWGEERQDLLHTPWDQLSGTSQQYIIEKCKEAV